MQAKRAGRKKSITMRPVPGRVQPIDSGSQTDTSRLPIASPEGLPNEEFLGDVQRILRTRRLTNGSFVHEFEGAAATYLGVPHCVAVSSCTSGLLLALRALDLRGEVILPSFTFFATAHSILWNGLKPVFADCDPGTFCVDPESVRQRISPETAAILAVHVFGNPAPVQELHEIAAQRNICVIYDAAHAFGSKVGARYVGSFGAAEVFSFSPTKLVVAGEGGMIATSDAALARRLRSARNYGDAGTSDPELIGLNARMSEFHAALALRGLDGLDQRIERRNQIRIRYMQLLRDVPGLSFQQIPLGSRSTCKDFAVVVEEAAFGRSRDWLADALLSENIEVKRYFWPPVHRQELYRGLWDGRPMPVTERISNLILNLPIYSSLRDQDVDRVCDAIFHALASARANKVATGGES
jgi:dTDP-4-amino-4,6-dideoxygalactose transaminase